MPLLVIYEAESYSLYYLDRIFNCAPVSGFRLPRWMPSAALTSTPRVPMCFQLLGEHPAEIFYGASSDLKLERLYTFSIRNAVGIFTSAANSMRHWSWSMSTGANCKSGRRRGYPAPATADAAHQPEHLAHAVCRSSRQLSNRLFPCGRRFPLLFSLRPFLALTARQITLLRRMLDEHSSTDFAYDCVESLLKLLLADLIRCEKKAFLPTRSAAPIHQSRRTAHR